MKCKTNRCPSCNKQMKKSEMSITLNGCSCFYSCKKCGIEFAA